MLYHLLVNIQRCSMPSLAMMPLRTLRALSTSFSWTMTVLLIHLVWWFMYLHSVDWNREAFLIFFKGREFKSDALYIRTHLPNFFKGLQTQNTSLEKNAFEVFELKMKKSHFLWILTKKIYWFLYKW